MLVNIGLALDKNIGTPPLRGDVLRQLLAAGADDGLGSKQAVLGHALGKLALQAREIRVGHLHLGTDFEHERMTVNTGEIHEGDFDSACTGWRGAALLTIHLRFIRAADFCEPRLLRRGV